MECKLCKTDTRKRVVLKRRPLKDITSEDPHPEVKKEFLCENSIRSLRPKGRGANGKLIYGWYEETCNNHMLIQILNIK